MSASKYLLFVFLIFLSSGITVGQQTIPKDTFITLKRFPCYGNCPFYKLTIAVDGSVVLEPYSYDEKYKVVSGKIGKNKISLDKLKQIISLFNQINYFSLENKYGSVNYKKDKNCPEIWTDNSSVVTSIKISGKFKQVYHYLGCQGSKLLEELTKFEDKIDEIVGTAQWLK